MQQGRQVVATLAVCHHYVIQDLRLTGLIVPAHRNRAGIRLRGVQGPSRCELVRTQNRIEGGQPHREPESDTENREPDRG